MRRIRECQCGRLYPVEARNPVASGTMLLSVAMVLLVASCWAWILSGL